MIKILKTIAWLAVYAIIYLISAFGAAFIIAMFNRGATPVEIEIFVIENLGLALIISAVLVVVLGFFVLTLRRRNPLRYLQFRALSAGDALATLLIGLGFALFLNGLLTLTEINTVLPDPVSEQISQAIAANLPMILIAIGLVVPFYEEFLFRGLVFKELQNSSKLWVALLLQGLLFGAIHANWFQFIYAFPVGVVLGLVFLRYQSLWAPILIHLGLNSTSALLSAFLPERVTAGVFWAMLFSGAALLFAGFYYTFKLKTPPPENTLAAGADSWPDEDEDFTP